MDQITLRFTPASADYDRAASVLKGGTSRREVIEAGVIYGLLFVVLPAALILYRKPGSPLSPQTIFLLVLTGATLLLLLIAPALQHRKKFNDNPQLTMPVTWVVDEEGITIINHMTRIYQRWRAFSEAVESPDYLYLVDAQNEKNFLFLTKKTLDSDQPLEPLRELLRQKIGLRAAGQKR